MICHVFLIFSVLFLAAVAGEAPTPVYHPTDVFLFNCGETSDMLDNNGRNWTVERKVLQASAVNASFASDASDQTSGVPLVPYMTARISRHDFTYSFPVSPGWKFLRLYFYPTRYGSDLDAAAAVDSFFSATVNGFTLLNNFSADLTAKYYKNAFIIKEFIVHISGGHTLLNLTFTPSPNSFAFVNGIEIVSMPDRFYSKGGFDDKIKFVGHNFDFEITNMMTAFETVYRVNVAGQMVDDVSDTGMFRRWLADDFLLSVNSGMVVQVPGVKINYSEKTPAYVAPEDVYTTYLTMGNLDNPRLNAQFNLTWLFPVDPGFNYLVRLHFCETLREVNGTGQRVFTIFIGNQTAMHEMDVIRLSGGSRIPVYLDFNVWVGFESGPRTDLRLDLHPYTAVEPKYYDAILNGVEILKLSVSDGNLAGPNPPNPTPSHTPDSQTQDIVKPKGKSHVLVITLGTIGFAIVVAMFVVVVAFVIVMKRKNNKKKVSVDTKSKPTDSWTTLPLVAGSSHTRSTTSLPSDLCRRFTILEIKSATNNFEKKLIVGVGGFGPVYKGRIDGGATLVAVKRLDISSNQGATEFEAELKMLSMLRHIHLVSLVGYCDDESEMVLVYEYMPHGTLRDHLYKRNKGFDPPMSWKRRLEICIGAARGIQYLHTGAKDMIIHRDIKTTNILLDENYVAKVSDFGLSKVGLTSLSQTHVSTVVKGSFGYLDPEYYRRQVLTEKSDVYSFGVVLFEVLCCRPVKLENVPREEADLIRWVKSNYKKGTVDQIVDADLTAEITPLSLEKFCEIAVRCVQDRGIERPSMNDVVWGLEFALQLHEAGKSKSGVDSLDQLPRRDEVGTTTDGDNDLFSRTTGRMSKSVTSDDDSARLAGDERSGSSWGVFSEIKDPKAR